MATAKIDTIEDLEVGEEYGVVTSVVRRAVVTGLTGATYATLYGALTAAGIPSPGAALDTGRGTNLALTRRSVKMIDSDKANVMLTYEHFASRGQPLYAANGSIAERNVSGKMSVTVAQKETNLYRPYGVGAQRLIVLEHTYPDTDADYAGRTITQSGMINVNLPQTVYTVEGIKTTPTPWVMARRLITAVNSKIWLGEDARTWMCTEVSWEYRGAANYFMTFGFQHDPDGHDPTAVFIDDRTSRPPLDLVDGIGILTIPYFREVDFAAELGFYVIGPQQ